MFVISLVTVLIVLEKSRIIKYSTVLLTSYSSSTVSKSIPSIFCKDRQERFDLFHDQIDLSITKKRAIRSKTDAQIPNPVKEQLPPAEESPAVVLQARLVPDVLPVHSQFNPPINKNLNFSTQKIFFSILSCFPLGTGCCSQKTKQEYFFLATQSHNS